MGPAAANLRGAPIPDAFPLAKAEGHNDAHIAHGHGLHVTTAAEQWSYAARIPRRRRLRGKDDDADPVIVTVLATVERGSIGFGLLGVDHKTFLDEQVRGAGDGEVRVELISGPLSSIDCLMIRNTDETGAPSACTIRAVETHLAQEIGLDAELAPPSTLQLRPDPNWSRHYGSVSRSLEESLRRRALGRLAEPRPMRWLEGLRILIYPSSEMCRAIFVSGVYEPNNALVMQRMLSDGDVVFDVGANMGAFTLLASRWVGKNGRVFAFEPSPRDCARLEQNVAINQLENVTRRALGLGESPGTAVLHVAVDEHGGHNTLGERFGYGDVAELEQRVVAISTIDQEVERFGLERLDFVKLDVEGAENRCLRGAARSLRALRPVLLFEVSPPSLEASGTSVGELERTVRDADYAPFEIDPQTSDLHPIADLSTRASENVVALPRERTDAFRARLAAAPRGQGERPSSGGG